ncbi:MAG: GNAT family N-acetyltransferase [Acidobacteria bacterium]|nr:GNAT family N-acetyltransferase [Acidobacteriota bacterium]MBV9070631.1 GNAT family N-acetyltransferase [Acidobacteriota bacterium]MBV9478182.1 GNAT family N-acetyltransferase [Acidobacteriota bacterium]
MSEVLVRAASRDDAPTIVAFQLAMARETEELALDVDVLARGVEAVFADPSKGRYFVVECDREVVASLMITYEWSDWRNGTVWWIQSVYVLPAQRKRGLYASLYRHVQSLIADDASVRGIRLYVDERNVPAQQVYARLGMNGEHYRVFEWMKEMKS